MSQTGLNFLEHLNQFGPNVSESTHVKTRASGHDYSQSQQRVKSHAAEAENPRDSYLSKYSRLPPHRTHVALQSNLTQTTTSTSHS